MILNDHKVYPDYNLVLGCTQKDSAETLGDLLNAGPG